MPEGAMWTQGGSSMNEHLRREIQVWEPQKIPLDTTSTYSAHFRAWPANRQPRATKPKDARPPSAAPFDTRSTMQDSFQPVRGDVRSKPFRPQSAYVKTDYLQPISTTHREAFQKWMPAPRPNFKPQQRAKEPGDYSTGRTTSQDAFPAHMPVMTRSCKPKENSFESFAFEGTSTSRAAFLQWPIPPKYVRTIPDVKTAFAREEPFPNSTYRDMFREIKLPKNNPHALGLQVVGGNFFTVMQRGTVPPATKKVMMTTVQDAQNSVDIVVILSTADGNRKGKVLGEFTLEGIGSAGKGVPQIEVTLNLDTQNVLRVTAFDVQGNRARALTVTDKVRLISRCGAAAQRRRQRRRCAAAQRPAAQRRSGAAAQRPSLRRGRQRRPVRCGCTTSGIKEDAHTRAEATTLPQVLLDQRDM